MLSEELLIKLQPYMQNPVGFLVLAGKNGVGKTLCAIRVYERTARFALPAFDRDDAWFVTQKDLNDLWSLENAEFGHSVRLLQSVANVRFLVIDDLGTRVPTPPFMDFLYGLADKRYKERLRKGTIITTNLTSTAIRDQFGDAFFSRICSGLVYKVTGPDRRFHNKEF